MNIKETEFFKEDKIKTSDKIFAVGDIHGDIDQLKAITEYANINYPEHIKVSLGDVIDRGIDSIACLNYVLENYDVYVPGNHELMMIGTIFNIPGYSETFFDNGGLWLYGLFKEKYDSNKHLYDILENELGDNFQRFIQDGKLLPTKEYNPKLHHKSGNVIFVHAGIMPGINYMNSIYNSNVYNFNESNPVWIRDKFLTHKSSYCKDENNEDVIVVHGHSFEHYIKHAPNIHNPNLFWNPGFTRLDGYRLGLDTGNYATGFLTGAIIENSKYKIISCEK